MASDAIYNLVIFILTDLIWTK